MVCQNKESLSLKHEPTRTSQLSEGGEELAGQGLDLVVSQRDDTDVFWHTAQDLEHAFWERDELAVWQICKEKECEIDINTSRELLILRSTRNFKFSPGLCRHLLVQSEIAPMRKMRDG